MRYLLCAAILLLANVAAAAEFKVADIVGNWTGKAQDGTEVKYEFRKDGSIVWWVEEPNFKQAFPNGLVGKYSLVEKKPLWEVDFTDFENEKLKAMKLLAILEPVSSEEFKMDAKPGQRPKTFSNETVVFKKAKATN